MTPPDPMRQNPDSIARNRFFLIALSRTIGVVVMLVGLVLWHGPVVREGGAPAIGAPAFFLGMAVSMLLPRWLARRWRSPKP